MTETKTTKFYDVDGEIVDADTLNDLRDGGLWLRNWFTDDPREDAAGADAFHRVLDLFEEHRARTLMSVAANGDYTEAECPHEDDVSMIHPKTGKHRTDPYADYVYKCNECGAIGYPDGPTDDSWSVEAIDWNRS